VTESLSRRIDDWAKAIRARGVERVVSVYAPNNVSFDLDPSRDTPRRTTNSEPGKNSSQQVLVPTRTR
jgi:ketosteroid isomerase-like protein